MVWSLEVHSTHRPARHGKVWSPLSESRQWLCNQDHRSEISGMIRFQVREFFVLKLAGLSMKWLSTYTRLEQTLFCWLQSQVCRTNLGYGTWVPLKLDSSCHMSYQKGLQTMPQRVYNTFSTRNIIPFLVVTIAASRILALSLNKFSSSRDWYDLYTIYVYVSDLPTWVCQKNGKINNGNVNVQPSWSTMRCWGFPWFSGTKPTMITGAVFKIPSSRIVKIPNIWRTA